MARALITRFGPSPLLENEVAIKSYVDAVPGFVAKIVKQADETRDTTTTFVNDAELVVPASALLANTVYSFTGIMITDSGAAEDIKFLFPLNDDNTGTRSNANIQTSTAIATVDLGTSLEPSTDGSIQMFYIIGRLVTGTTPGEFALQWAQRVSGAGNTTLKAGSSLALFTT